MKRRQLLRHILEHGCFLVREGSRHSVYCNSSTGKISTVPRHAEVNDYLRGKSAAIWESQFLRNLHRPDLPLC